MKLYIFIMFFIVITTSISCVNNEVQLSNKNDYYIDTVLEKDGEYQYMLESLDSFYLLVKNETEFSDSFFNYFVDEGYQMSFLIWKTYKEKKYDEACILLFLKMFNNSEKLPYGTFIHNQMNKSTALYIFAERYFELSGADPMNCFDLNDVVTWVIISYDFTKNEDIFNEVKIIEGKFPVVVKNYKKRNILIPDSLKV